jgi:hypothetical protein
MPRNALSHDGGYYRATVAELPALLTRMVNEAPGAMPPIPHQLIAQARFAARKAPTETADPSRQRCAQCGGMLNEVAGPDAPDAHCQEGQIIPAAMRHHELDRALESALQMHRRRVAMFRRMQESSEAQGLANSAARWRAGADESAEAARVIMDAIATLRKAAV